MTIPAIEALKEKELRTRIFRLAWPTVTENALQTVVQYVDTAQVGLLGAAASAAVGLTSTTTWLVNAPLWAVATGILACISQSLGAGDRERAGRAADQSLLLVLILGFAMTLLTLVISPFLPVWLGADEAIRRDASVYFAVICAPMLFRVSSILFAAVLRASGDTRTPMWIGLTMNAINILLNFLLIGAPRTWQIGPWSLHLWGAGLGVAGAAIATAVSYIAGGILMFQMARKCSLLSGLRLRYDRKVMGQCIRISTPIGAEHIVSMLGQVVFTALIARLGTVAVATHAIAITAEQAFYIPGYGMETAASTLSGFYYGAGDEKKLMAYSSAILTCAVVLMTFLSLFLFLFPAFFMGIFTPDQDVIELGAKVLRIVSVSEPFYAVVIILQGTFNGVGDVKAPLTFSLMCMWGVRLGLTFLCVTRFHLGLTAVWWCMVTDNLTRFVLMVTRYCGRKWRRPGSAKLSM